MVIWNTRKERRRKDKRDMNTRQSEVCNRWCSGVVNKELWVVSLIAKHAQRKFCVRAAALALRRGKPCQLDRGDFHMDPAELITGEIDLPEGISFLQSVANVSSLDLDGIIKITIFPSLSWIPPYKPLARLNCRRILAFFSPSQIYPSGR